MVSRFIKHENFRFAEDNFGKSDSHSPASRESFGSSVKFFLGEAETCQDSDSFDFLGRSLNHLNSLIHFCYLVAYVCFLLFCHLSVVHFFKLLFLLEQTRSLNVAV